MHARLALRFRRSCHEAQGPSRHNARGGPPRSWPVRYLEACIGIFIWTSPLEMSVGQATPGLAALAVDSPMPKVALSRPPVSDLPLTGETAENPNSGDARPLTR
jgi:hypothetical protein